MNKYSDNTLDKNFDFYGLKLININKIISE